ncbi:MAG: peptidase [Myxococcaceae bacterium]|nr:peptidase [Myxococcaceae bacterium]
MPEPLQTRDLAAHPPCPVSTVLAPRSVMGGWLWWVAVVHALLLATFFVNRPIPPRDAAASSATFSEQRALSVLKHLTNDFGPRLAGTSGAERAAEYLAEQLRALPGVEVELQHASDSRLFRGTFVPWPVIKYRVTNVVARIPGRTRDAILLDAHFDTLGDSPGAGDDGVGVVAILEAARALAAGPQLERSVIILFNGGEEYGLYGADAFIRKHPLAKDVRAYLYIDGGPGGATTLLYSGPGTSSLVEAYARVAPRPQASSLYLDMIESGLLSHDGDHRPFRDQNIPGLLFAPIADMWAPHTRLDRYDRVEPGTIQHVGQTALQVTRELASSGVLPHGVEAERSIYFDLFGLCVVRYRASIGVVLGASVVMLALLAVWLARPLLGVTFGLRDIISVLGYAFASALAAVIAAVAVGLVLALVLRRGHGWYAEPWIAYGAFVAPACAASCALHAPLRRRLVARGLDPLSTVWSVCVLGWSLVLLLATLAQARSGYIPLLWTSGLALGLLASVRFPARRGIIALIAITPGLYTLVQLGPLMRTMCAQMGMQPLPIPGDPVIGLLCGLLVAIAGAALALPAHAFGGVKQASSVMAALALAGIVLSATTFPFTSERPRRVLVTHAEENGRSALLLRARDALPLAPVLTQLPDARPVRAGWTSFEVFQELPTHELPAPAPAFARPSAEVLAMQPHADGTRTVTLRLHSETPNLRMFVEHGRVARWSLHEEVSEPPLAAGRATVYFQGFPSEGETITVTLRGSAPVEVELIASTFASSPVIRRMTATFPRWAVPVPLAARSVKLKI